MTCKANVVQQANADGAVSVGLYPSREDWPDARRAAGIGSRNYDDMYAGELESQTCSPLTRLPARRLAERSYGGVMDRAAQRVQATLLGSSRTNGSVAR
jgi:hypothetical protein